MRKINMKTTSYEISKKLKEAGFEDSYIYAWYSDSEGLPWIQEIQHAKPTAVNKYREEVKLTFVAPAYDLETILDALPARIEKNEKMYDLLLRHNILGYYATSLKLDYDNIQLDDYIFELYDHDKSLADTAGRLLIELFEAGIINFKK